MYKIARVLCLLKNCFSLSSGDTTKKRWAHQFLAKPKTIAVGGSGEGGCNPCQGPGQQLVEGLGAKLPNNFAFFL